MVPGRLPVILFCCFLSRFCDMYLSSLDLDGTSEFCCILAPYPVFKYPEYPSTEHSGSVPAATSLPAGGHLPRQPAAPLLLPRPVPPCLGQRGRRRALTPRSCLVFVLASPLSARQRGCARSGPTKESARGIFGIPQSPRREGKVGFIFHLFSLFPLALSALQPPNSLPSRAGPRRSTWGWFALSSLPPAARKLDSLWALAHWLGAWRQPNWVLDSSERRSSAQFRRSIPGPAAVWLLRLQGQPAILLPTFLGYPFLDCFG